MEERGILGFDTLASFPPTGDVRYFYVDDSDKNQYYWDGSTYVLYLVVTPSGGYVPYTGATNDVDLDTHSLNARSLHAKGTGGNGHLGLKHQSADITASASESSLGANSSGNPVWKNDGNPLQKVMLENTAITGATKTKITYDSKGLVTGGTDATTEDIADSLNKRYVTDAEKTVIGNTSGTNTGDETTTTIQTKRPLKTLNNQSFEGTGDIRITGRLNTLSLSGAGTTTITQTAGYSIQYIDVALGAGTYVRNIRLSSTNAVEGNEINIMISLPASVGVTVNLIDDATSSLILTYDSWRINNLPTNIIVFNGVKWDWRNGGYMPYQKVAWATTDDLLKDYLNIPTQYSAIITSTQTNTTVTPATLTGNTFTIPPGKSLFISAGLIFTSGNTGNGAYLGLAVNQPAGANGNAVGNWDEVNNQTATSAATALTNGGAFNVGANTTSQQGIIGNNSSAGNNSATITGRIKNNSTNVSTIVRVEFRSETAGVAIIAQIGSGATAIIG